MKLCYKCHKKRRKLKNKYCNPCHAENIRNWRKTHPLSAEQRKKSICRSYTRVYITRGKIQRLACEVCGSKKSQVHHPDYNKPLLIKWLCRKHHLELHAMSRPTSLE